MKKAYLIIIGRGLFGGDWIPILKDKKYFFKKELENSLSRKYNERQRLSPGVKYKVYILSGDEIEKKQERTTANLKKLAEQKFRLKSFEDTKGEGAFLVRLEISNEKMKEMGYEYMATLHESFEDDYGDCGHIVFDHFPKDNIYLYYEDMNDYWAKKGGFIFLEKIEKKIKKPL